MSSKLLELGPSGKKPETHRINRKCKLCGAILSIYNSKESCFRHNGKLLGTKGPEFNTDRQSTGKGHLVSD